VFWETYQQFNSFIFRETWTTYQQSVRFRETWATYHQIHPEFGVAPVGIPLIVPGGLGGRREEGARLGWLRCVRRSIFSSGRHEPQCRPNRWATLESRHPNSEALVSAPSGGSSASPIEKGREVLSSSLAARRFGWGSWRPCWTVDIVERMHTTDTRDGTERMQKWTSKSQSGAHQVQVERTDGVPERENPRSPIVQRKPPDAPLKQEQHSALEYAWTLDSQFGP
jgi:hypothetical protein